MSIAFTMYGIILFYGILAMGIALIWHMIRNSDEMLNGIVGILFLWIIYVLVTHV